MRAVIAEFIINAILCPNMFPFFNRMATQFSSIKAKRKGRQPKTWIKIENSCISPKQMGNMVDAMMFQYILSSLAITDEWFFFISLTWHLSKWENGKKKYGLAHSFQHNLNSVFNHNNNNNNELTSKLTNGIFICHVEKRIRNTVKEEEEECRDCTHSSLWNKTETIWIRRHTGNKHTLRPNESRKAIQRATGHKQTKRKC